MVVTQQPPAGGVEWHGDACCSIGDGEVRASDGQGTCDRPPVLALGCVLDLDEERPCATAWPRTGELDVGAAGAHRDPLPRG